MKNERLTSRKYLVGESYGGFRGPRITHFLQTQLGVAMNGLVLVSPYLQPAASDDGDLSPLPWMLTLPSIAASNLERQGKLTDATMGEIVSYTRGEYVTDLLKGRSDPKASSGSSSVSRSCRGWIRPSCATRAVGWRHRLSA